MTAPRLVPISREDANTFLARHHRHHPPVVGDIFRTAVATGSRIVGVAVVGRPVSRIIQQREPQTVELTRLCTSDDAPTNTASKLLGAVRRGAWALGYTRLITYTLVSEPGTSLRAAGYRVVGEIKGRSWDTPSRPRIDRHVIADRTLWETAPAAPDGGGR